MTFPAYSPIGYGETSSLSLPIQAQRDPVSHVDLVSPNGSPYIPGSTWINEVTKSVFFFQGSGTWILQSNIAGDLLSLSDNANTIVSPSGSGNIKIAGTANQVSTLASTNTITVSLTGPYSPATYTDHGVLVGSGTAAIDALAVGTTGQVLIGSTGADPAFGALGVNSGLTDHGVLVGGGNTAIDALAVGTTGQVLIGSTGADPAFGALGVNSGLTDHGVLVGSGNAAIDALAVGTNGQVLIGSTGADPVFGTIASTTLTSTLGAGTLTLDVASSLYAKTSVTLTSQQIKAIETTPITLVAAQGANTSIMPIQIQAKLVYGGTSAFTNVQDLELRYQNGAGDVIASIVGTGFLDQTASTYNLSGIDQDVIAAATMVENQPLVLFNSNAAITGNAADDNTVIVTLVYAVLTNNQ